jgi:hypothetical protein
MMIIVTSPVLQGQPRQPFTSSRHFCCVHCRPASHNAPSVTVRQGQSKPNLHTKTNKQTNKVVVVQQTFAAKITRRRRRFQQTESGATLARRRLIARLIVVATTPVAAFGASRCRCSTASLASVVVESITRLQSLPINIVNKTCCLFCGPVLCVE